MAMLEVLTEVVCSEEFLRLVALAEFVDVVQMLRADVPLWWIGELITAIATDIGAIGTRLMESGFRPGQRGA